MHNGIVRASSRLVLVWTSVSLTAVAVGWAALSSAVSPGGGGQTEVAALDPSILSPSVTPKPSASPTALPSSVPPSPGKAARTVPEKYQQPRAAVTTGPPTRPVTRPNLSPSTPPPAVGDTRGQPERADAPDYVRHVNCQGGLADIAFTGTQVYLADYTPSAGFTVDGKRESPSSIVVRFVGPRHVSTVHAYVDGDGAYHVDIQEEVTA